MSNDDGGDASRREKGRDNRVEVLGEAWVERAEGARTDFDSGFQDLITRYAWAEIWGDETIDRRMRSAVTLTALVAGGHLEELAGHVRGARSNGLSDAEIAAILRQCAIYCGVPAANSAFKVAKRTLAELDEEEQG